MRLFRIGSVIVSVLLFTSFGLAETAGKKLTPEEIKKMTETSAVIETKLGNIELRFFPDVAPITCKTLSTWAKRDFTTGRRSTE